MSLTWLRGLGPDEWSALRARHLAASESGLDPDPHGPARGLERFAGRLAVKVAVRSWHVRHTGTRMRTRDVRVDTVRSGLRRGKPFVNAPVGVNLSHSGEFAVAACGPGAVGIDLERNRAMGPHLTSLLAFDGDTEGGGPGHRLRTMPLPLRWACKEAVLKYLGFGLRFGAREVRLTDWRADDRFTWAPGPLLAPYAPLLGEGVESWAHDDVGGYSLALVWRRPPGPQEPPADRGR
ncbi:hypothetical protein RND61_12115 [Streptomyces sp. TRM76323]|uniref:4'-phosphopantetheinyl transferase domain-containing protein n=1 Tax=Streptomyces tamarix TaxID=3078565 RepID=A0ABU3QJ54_9ACTN|nr:hypothetical protein [Streptomyces tamarix]MDT9682810.1 hypothetical protein [Streptomyces tamarix]